MWCNVRRGSSVGREGNVNSIFVAESSSLGKERALLVKGIFCLDKRSAFIVKMNSLQVNGVLI